MLAITMITLVAASAGKTFLCVGVLTFELGSVFLRFLLQKSVSVLRGSLK